MSISDELKQHLVSLGRKGGRSKSPGKIAAVLKNLEKANEARWKKSFKGKIAGKRGRQAR